MLIEAADLDLVAASSLGCDPKRAKDWLPWLEHLQRRDLGAPPPTAQRDFFLVGGVPALRLRRPFQDGARPRCLARATPLRADLRRRVLPSHRVRILQHVWTVGRAAQFDQ